MKDRDFVLKRLLQERTVARVASVGDASETSTFFSSCLLTCLNVPVR